MILVKIKHNVRLPRICSNFLDAHYNFGIINSKTAAHCGFEKHIKNNTSPGDSWTIIAGEKSQFEVSEVLVRIEKAIMHDYTHFAGKVIILSKIFSAHN